MPLAYNCTHNTNPSWYSVAYMQFVVSVLHNVPEVTYEVWVGRELGHIN